MKNMRKRFVAAFFALVMLFDTIGVLFPVTVYATIQPPVTTLDLNPEPTNNLFVYSLMFSWQHTPLIMTNPNLDIPGTDIVYSLSYRNATTGRVYTEEEAGRVRVEDVTTTLMTYRLQSSSLDRGSLYVFTINPFHLEERQLGTGGATSTQVRPNVGGNEIIFLTDIEVEAYGVGNQLNVTWDNPRFGGGNLFTGYRIYYVQGGGAAPIPLTSNNSNYVTVGLNDPNLRINAEGKWTYSFTAELETNTIYAVKVEPLLGGRVNADGEFVDAFEARDRLEVTYNNKTYELRYSDRTLKEYRDNTTMVRPGLNGRESERDKLLLYWDDFNQSVRFTVTRLELFRTQNPMPSSQDHLLVTLFQNAIPSIVQFLTDRPSVITYYYYRITYLTEDGNGNTIESWTESNMFMYDPTVTPFTPVKPTILDAVPIPDEEDVPPESIDLYWEALFRNAITDLEIPLLVDEYGNSDPVNGKLIDRDVIYDLWITDDITNYANSAFNGHMMATLGGQTLTDIRFPLDAGPGERATPAYKHNFTEYTTLVDGSFVTAPITDNKIYYFKVRVTRDTPDREYAEAYFALYVPPAGNIVVNPIMLARPPLRIKTVDNVEEITTNSITITWDLRWIEAFNDADKNWYTEIGVGLDGSLFFGKDIPLEVREAKRVLSLNEYPFLNDVRVALAALGASQDDIGQLPLREMDLTGTEPRIHVVEKSHVDIVGGYEAYIDSLLASDNDPTILDSIWRVIEPEPEGDPMHPEYTITESDLPMGPLQENTSYVIIFRPFLPQANEPLKAYYPTYVLGTTLITKPPIIITPTVPTLIGDSHTDMTITVKWAFTEGFAYELSYGELASQYPDNGIIIPWEEILENGRIEIGDDGIEYMYYTIRSLFPDTTYFMWVRAIVHNETESLYSSWSNPIAMRTDDIRPPKPPQGLGLASEESLDIINKETSQNLLPIDYNYMILEWLRDANDPETLSTDSSAVIGGSAEALSSPDISVMLLAKFNELTANKMYYVRAKTRLTVTKIVGGASLMYQYIVQVSLSPDFVDVIEITIPAETTNANDLSFTRESDWTLTLNFITSRYGGEYDGDKNNNMYPLPQQDFEIIYVSETDTLILRFRSNEIDSEGNRDNMVDQRFISKLIAQKTYNYVLDVTTYDNQEVSNRVIEIPYSIISAFDERKINLTVRSGDLTTTFPAGFTKTQAVNSVAGKGSGSSVRLTFLSVTETQVPDITSRSNYLTNPQKIEINFMTQRSNNSSNISIENTAQPLSISLRLANRYVVIDSNVGAYTASAGDNTWSRQNSVYDNVSGQINFTTNMVATYSSISIAPPEQTANDNASAQAMITISSLMNIQDINYYYPEALTSASQLNKLIAAVAKESKDVGINEPLTESEFSSLQKSGLLITSEKTIPREEAINSLVRLYEIKTRKQIRNYTPLSNMPSSNDITTASESYQQSLLKAVSIGLLEDDISTRPQDAITLTETLQIIDIIILDAGI